MSEQHYGPFQDQYCSNPSLVKKCDVCCQTSRLPKHSGPSFVCYMVSSQARPAIEETLGKYGIGEGERGEEEVPGVDIWELENK